MQILELLNPILNPILKPAAKGVSLAEYGLLGVLVTVACFTAMQMLGGQISRIVIDSCNAIANVIASTTH